MAIFFNLIVFGVIVFICFTFFLGGKEEYSPFTKTIVVALAFLAATPLAWRWTYPLTPSFKRGVEERYNKEKQWNLNNVPLVLAMEFYEEDFRAYRSDLTVEVLFRYENGRTSLRNRKERLKTWKEAEKRKLPDWPHWLVGWPVPLLLFGFLLDRLASGERNDDDGWTYL